MSWQAGQWAAVACYGIGLVGYWIKFFQDWPEEASDRLRWVVGVGCLVQIVVVVGRWAAAGTPPLAGYRDSLFFLGLAIAGLLVLVEKLSGVGILGGFVLPIAVVGVARAATVIPREASREVAMSGWLTWHVVATFTSYALLILAFGVGLTYLIQERQLRLKRFGSVVHRLPALEVLDHLSALLIQSAVPLLAVGLATGIAWTHHVAQVWLKGDPKEWWTAATLILYGSYLGLRTWRGWRGRTAVYFSLIGFIVMLVTYIGVNVIGHHHYS